MVRIQVLLSPEEKLTFKRMAARDGLSLSAWLREAGRARLAAARQRGPFRSGEELEQFFLRCDEHQAAGREPEWDEHLATMRRSRGEGRSGT